MAEMSAFWHKEYNESTISWPIDNLMIAELDLERHPILVQYNDTYKIVDYNIEGLTVSVTELHKGKATRGHSHPHAECYFFKTDAGIRLGHTHYEVKAGQLLMVKPKQFHRVYAMPDKEAVFVCVFEGLRNETGRDYTPPKAP